MQNLLDVKLEIKGGTGRARRKYGVKLDSAFIMQATLLQASKIKLLLHLSVTPVRRYVHC